MVSERLVCVSRLTCIDGVRPKSARRLPRKLPQRVLPSALAQSVGDLTRATVGDIVFPAAFSSQRSPLPGLIYATPGIGRSTVLFPQVKPLL